MISNEYALKLCLEHEVKRGNKVVKKELIVALRGEIYFVKYIINPEEDDVEPRVILGRTFLRMTKAITNFWAGTVTLYPEFDPFLEDIEEEEKSLDDWDHLPDFNLDDVPLLGGEELPSFICKMGKSNQEAAKEALAIRISQKFALLEEERHSIFSLCYLFRNPFASTSIGDENHIRTLGDYSKPSHEGYRNTIELPVGNNVDPNQHLKDFLKLVDSLDLDGENRERMQRDQASNWLERLLAGSITTWEDLTTQSLSEAWTRFKDLLQKVPHHCINLWLQVQIFYDHVNPVIRRTIDQSAGGKLRDRNAEESWALLEDLALYDNESWNDQRDFAKPVKAITLPQDVPSTSDYRLIKLENQVVSLSF
ncbi:hypothetical protein Tco_0953510 [Tanacetum coccineum]|uniref:MAK10-like protein n=1 Tax=Tanacetum coccineum TaxID=301880 RepID=A0ABQ5E037_9ASTR